MEQCKDCPWTNADTCRKCPVMTLKTLASNVGQAIAYKKIKEVENGR